MHSILYVTIFYRENGIRFDSTVVNNEFYIVRVHGNQSERELSFDGDGVDNIQAKQNAVHMTETTNGYFWGGR